MGDIRDWTTGDYEFEGNEFRDVLRERTDDERCGLIVLAFVQCINHDRTGREVRQLLQRIDNQPLQLARDKGIGNVGIVLEHLSRRSLEWRVKETQLVGDRREDHLDVAALAVSS